MFMTSSNPVTSSTRAPDIDVSIADDGGWVITIDRDGGTIATERYTDWHRVERRVAILKLTSAPDVLRVAATWLCAHVSHTAALGA